MDRARPSRPITRPHTSNYVLLPAPTLHAQTPLRTAMSLGGISLQSTHQLHPRHNLQLQNALQTSLGLLAACSPGKRPCIRLGGSPVLRLSNALQGSPACTTYGGISRLPMPLHSRTTKSGHCLSRLPAALDLVPVVVSPVPYGYIAAPSLLLPCTCRFIPRCDHPIPLRSLNPWSAA